MTTLQDTSSTSLALSNREEDELLKQTKKEALSKCDDVVRDFAECSTGRTFSVSWACRGQYRLLQQCMRQYTSEEAMGERRRAYLREKRARKAAQQHGLQGDVTLEDSSPSNGGDQGAGPSPQGAFASTAHPTTLASSSSDTASAPSSRGISYLWNYKPANRVV